MPAYNRIEDAIWEIPRTGSMLVPARIYATRKLLEGIEQGAMQQLVNTAALPGIQKWAVGESDMHFGYGFPIGGVAAFDLDEGIVSPGGIGFDINCGVRLIKTNLSEAEIRPKLKHLIDRLFNEVPAGLGEKGKIRVDDAALREALADGAKWAVKNGYGWDDDLAHIEENGRMEGAKAENVSRKAMDRGKPQFGSLGSGNHFLEVQRVEEIYDGTIAKEFGLHKGQIVVMLHCGSRGFGHQVASDYLDIMLRAMGKYGISVNDRQLCCAPINSDEGQKYLSAMQAAVNYAFSNRQVMTHWIRQVFGEVLGKSAEEMEMNVLYDICHNVAKYEMHNIEGKARKVLVHRKGATRAMPAGREENPAAYRGTGHPALLPGSMGASSYIVVGTEKGLNESFASVAHGAGRIMSRHEAIRRRKGADVKRELEERGQVVKGASAEGLAEEAPEAYKNIDEVVESVLLSGIGKKVARNVPLGVMKG